MSPYQRAISLTLVCLKPLCVVCMGMIMCTHMCVRVCTCMWRSKVCYRMSSLLLFLHYLCTLFLFFSQMSSCCVALGFALKTVPASNSQRCTCLCLPGVLPHPDMSFLITYFYFVCAWVFACMYVSAPCAYSALVRLDDHIRSPRTRIRG